SACARWRRAIPPIARATAALCGSATAAITRGPSGDGCSGRSASLCIASPAMQRQGKLCCSGCATRWRIRPWGPSVRSSTAIRRTTPVAPPHRPGWSPSFWTNGECLGMRKTPAGSRPHMPPAIDAERQRIEESRNGTKDWRRWGPYLSERQWGTVREDGIAGFSDNRQLLCLSIALWNGRDPILKERLFGLTNGEGNHGEDVKELYYYLDAVPSYAYARTLYKLPQ